jgi:hypothetical protein
MKDFIKLILIVHLVSLALAALLNGIMAVGLWEHRYEILAYKATCDQMEPLPDQTFHPCGCQYRVGYDFLIGMFGEPETWDD